MAIQNQVIELSTQVTELKASIEAERAEVVGALDTFTAAVSSLQAQLDALSVDSPELAQAIADVQSAKEAVAAIYVAPVA